MGVFQRKRPALRAKALDDGEVLTSNGVLDDFHTLKHPSKIGRVEEKLAWVEEWGRG